MKEGKKLERIKVTEKEIERFDYPTYAKGSYVYLGKYLQYIY